MEVLFSLSTNTAIETEGTVVTFNFEVTGGDIPEGGLPVNLGIDAADALYINDFSNFSRTGENPDTGELDSLFLLANPVGIGGRLNGSGTIAITDRIPQPFSTFPLILTESTASFELTVFDDIFAEADEVITFSIEPGAGFTSASDPVSLTILDSPEGIVNPSDVPIIGVSIDSSGPFIEDIIGENRFTITFDVEGEIPAEGIPFVLESETFDILGEFDIGSIESTGFADGGFSGTPLVPIEFGRGFLGTLTEDGATLSVSVANDAVDEGEQTLDFFIPDGELFDVDPDNSTVSVTIVDPVPDSTEGTDGDDSIVGETNNNIISALGGNDFVDGNLGSDTLDGGDGDDTLFGNDGVDSIIGGAGNDLIESGIEGFADFAEGGEGDDTIIGGITDENGEFVPGFGNTTFDGGDGADFLQGSGQRATLTGGAGDDTLFGGGNDSELDGGDGNDFLEAVGSTTGSGIPNFSDDTLLGGPGDDTLTAFADDDVLDGGDGNDIIDGGADEDTLTGGAGNDTFIIAPETGSNLDDADIITDFVSGEDLIGLAGGLTFDDLSFSGNEILLGEEVLATLTDFDTTTLVASNFVETSVGVSLSLSTETAIETEETVVTFNFEVIGEIPEEGLEVNFGIDADSPLWITDFNNFSRTNVNDAGQIASSLRFSNSVGFGNDGARVNAPGVVPFDSTSFVIVENQASFEVTVFDDFLAEENEEINFSIEAGEGYTATSGPVSLTIQDSPDGIVNPSDVPIVGISVDSSGPFIEDLVGQNQLTVTFDIEGTIPDEGVSIILESDTFDILGDFDPASVVTQGIADGSFGGLSPLEFGRGFAVTLLEDNATLTINVANDGIEEGEQTIDFFIPDGELYDIDPDNSTASVTIVDAVPDSTEGTDGDDSIVGGTNNNAIDVGAGNDFVDGNLGNDTIDAGSGDDTIFGGDGIDSIIGGDGNDLIESGIEGFADFAEGGSGDDTIIGGITDENGEFVPGFGNTTFDGGDGVDFIQGGGQRATLTGGAGDDTIFGGGNDSVLDGGDGNDFLEAVGSTTNSGIPNFSDDTIIGGQGNDTLTAFADDDVLDGGDGDDILDGGADEDTLTGGAGNDTFIIAPETGSNIEDVDIITDFGNGADVIGLAGGLTFSDLSFSGNEILFGDEVLATLTDFDTTTLVESDFISTGGTILDAPFVRFQNSSIPGTYVYATGAEADNIRANLPGFVEEGFAFNAAIAPSDELIALNRLESNQLPGTFLYVGAEELASINADPNFSGAFTDQGVAFYTYGAGAGVETPFNRFQNTGVPGTYLYATGAEADSIRANFPGFVDEGIAFEAGI
ncbi:MAG: calcium-binding protein [Cyanobacteria bacterium P01_F01_bin.143]